MVCMLATALALTSCGSSKKAAITPTTTTPADGLIQAGITAADHGNAAAAVADYQAALKADPLSNIAYYDLGVIYQQKGEVTGARTSYQKAILIDPTYKSALFNLAILDTPTDPAMALSLYTQLLGLNENDSNVLFNLGLLLRQTGQTAQGNADLAKAIRIDPALASRVPATTTTTKP
jgi:Tfp pilus assembly protein PilF